MLHDFNIPVNPMVWVACKDTALGAAEQLGYRVLLKTSKAGIWHKSEHDGIKLDIRNAQELSVAFEELSKRLGQEMLLSSIIGQHCVAAVDVLGIGHNRSAVISAISK